jgi:hypothetical protein
LTGFNHDAALGPELRAKLDSLEIAVVPRDVYEWRGYRYSNPSDAIAAAQRAAR